MTPAVSGVRCHSYQEPELGAAVRRAIGLLPGASDVLRGGRSVLLKPNIVSPRAPERAVCTHPAFVRAVAGLFLEAGCQVTVSDQPTYLMTPNAGEVFAGAQYLEALQGLDVSCVLLGAAGYAPVAVGQPFQWEQVQSARLLQDFDLIVNLPKCKTHTLTTYTGAVKNMFGAMAPRQRVEMHALGTYAALSGSVVDAYAAARPHLNVLDGILAMEGPGPSQGRPRHWGAVLASTDAVALDDATERLIGLAAGEVLSTTMAAEAGLGSLADGDSAMVGDDPEGLRIRIRRPPPLARAIPAWAGRIGPRLLYVRPRVIASKCIACGGCVRVCPADAVSIRADAQGRRTAQIDCGKCIECFCCTEACPEDAIAVHRSLLSRFM